MATKTFSLFPPCFFFNNSQVRPSVTFMVSEPCTCCHATGRVEALETSFSKIEHEIGRSLVSSLTFDDLVNISLFLNS